MNETPQEGKVEVLREFAKAEAKRTGIRLREIEMELRLMSAPELDAIFRSVTQEAR